VQEEVSDCLDFAVKVLEIYGFDKVRFELSVRGDADNKLYLGSDGTWESAETQLAAALKARGISYERIEGEAAFYGPKIDIKIEDAIGRIWQLGTIQVDWNLPERFELEYTGEDNLKHRPVMIHRALFGSMERFFGVLIEHYAGAFPLWLAPVQVAVLPITDRINEYADSITAELKAAGFRVEANTRSDKIGAKIRDAQLQKVPYMLILGDKELEEQKVAVRDRKQGDIGAMSLQEFLEKITAQRASRSL
jgi:threonyl-tRNA synthetase